MTDTTALFIREEVCTKARLQELMDENLDREQMAAVLKVHPDSIRRAMRRHELVEIKPHNVITPAQRRRIMQLGAEGMISTWIAEDVGLSKHTVKKVLGPRPEAARAWQQMWQGIRRDETLYALHCSLNPRGEVNA
jgi:IS30 family transposase